MQAVFSLDNFSEEHIKEMQCPELASFSRQEQKPLMRAHPFLVFACGGSLPQKS